MRYKRIEAPPGSCASRLRSEPLRSAYPPSAIRYPLSPIPYPLSPIPFSLTSSPSADADPRSDERAGGWGHSRASMRSVPFAQSLCSRLEVEARRCALCYPPSAIRYPLSASLLSELRPHPCEIARTEGLVADSPERIVVLDALLIEQVDAFQEERDVRRDVVAERCV